MTTKQQQQQQHQNGTQTKTAPPPDSEQLLSELLEKATVALEDTAATFTHAIEDTDSRVMKAMLTAEAMERIDKLLTDEVMARFMKLQNTRVGFMTDQKNGYNLPIVRRCLCEAFLHNVGPFNNEFNIIQGNVMLVQNGWRRKVAELPGMTKAPVISVGDPEETPKYYKFLTEARWEKDGQEHHIAKHVYVKRDSKERKRSDGTTYTLDDSTTIDNLVGKVERKMLQSIYQIYRPTSIGDSDIDAEESVLKAANQAATQQQQQKKQDPPGNPKRAAALDRSRKAYKALIDAKAYGPEQMAVDLGNKPFEVESVAQLDDTHLESWAAFLEARVSELSKPDPSDPPDGKGDAYEPPAE